MRITRVEIVPSWYELDLRHFAVIFICFFMVALSGWAAGCKFVVKLCATHFGQTLYKKYTGNSCKLMVAVRTRAD